MKKTVLICSALAALFAAFYLIQVNQYKKETSNDNSITELETSIERADTRKSDKLLPASEEGGNAVIPQDEEYTQNESSSEAEKQAEVQSLNTFLSQSDGGRVLKTETLDQLSVEELQRQVDELAQQELSTVQATTFKTQLSTLLSTKADVYTNALQCSDALCGVMISDLSRERVSAVLDELTRDPSVSEATSGGYLRIVEQDGTYYGVFVGVIADGSALSIR